MLVPNIEDGNMIYKDIPFMADSQSTGLVVGTRVPVILTSRVGGTAAILCKDAQAHDPAGILPEPAE